MDTPPHDPDVTRSWPPPDPSTSPSPGVDTDALPPGYVVNGRFRVSAKLGRGGMGTVYRAEDLKLGQEIAIKFLIGREAHHPARVAALLHEVRTARRVSHKHVCRVHDIGELDGRPFLTMEYVRGEDLGSLLCRIGRLPIDKALEIALQIGAALQAAHDQGVIHRDLKPANVMLDEQGNARITDFGIAAAVEELDAESGLAGTPSYMAPELFVGAVPSAQTDVFALGAMLYEILSGRAPFRADTLEALRAQHGEPVPPLIETVPGVPADVDRVILRCMARNPHERPTSAVELLRALPGWDPLGDALARGETPSPSQVASAHGSGRLSARQAAWLVVGLVAILTLNIVIVQRRGLVANSQLPHSGQVLAEDARRHLAALGYPFDRDAEFEAWSFDFYQELIREIAAKETGPERWRVLAGRRPTAIDFYYRRSPQPLVPGFTSLHLAWQDPPIRVPGMVQVRLDPAGGLRELVAVPEGVGRVDESPSTVEVEATAPDWNVVLGLAALAPRLLEPATPRRIPQVFADRRAAWTGTYPESGIPIRVEAASLSGRVVSFRVVERELPAASLPPAENASEDVHQRTSWSLGDLIGLVVGIGGAYLAWTAVRTRRANYRDAARFAIFVIGLVDGATLLMAEHMSDVGAEVELCGSALVRGLMFGALYWALYLGLEPQVRRVWPEVLVSWTRLLEGRFRDPLVCSNTLAGIAAGAGVLLLELMRDTGVEWFELTGSEPIHQDLVTAATLNGVLAACGALFQLSLRFLGFAVVTVITMVLVRSVLRHRRWSAIVSIALVTGTFQAESSMAPWVQWPVAALQATVCVYCVTHHGMLGLAIGAATYGVLHGFPVTFDIDAWYAGAGLLALLDIGLVVTFGVSTLVRKPVP
ncbi:MAG: serine/threonine-protein kinase [Planctomycetota bacterium]